MRRPVLVLTIFAALARAAAGQTKTAAALPAFDVVSVKKFQFSGRPWDRDAHFDPQRLYIQGMAPVELIDLAYSLNRNQLTGLPQWAQFSHDSLYSVTATASKPASRAQMLLMLRQVLADRFQLVLKVVDKVQPVYDLEVAPGGPKLAPLKPGDDCETAVDAMRHGRAFPAFEERFDVCTISELVSRLNIPNFGVDRPVIDKTQLNGQFPIAVFLRLGDVTPVTIHGLTGWKSGYLEPMAEALKEQLGLMLVKAMGPYRTYQVTHIAQPAPDN